MPVVDFGSLPLASVTTYVCGQAGHRSTRCLLLAYVRAEDLLDESVTGHNGDYGPPSRASLALAGIGYALLALAQATEETRRA